MIDPAVHIALWAFAAFLVGSGAALAVWHRLGQLAEREVDTWLRGETGRGDMMSAIRASDREPAGDGGSIPSSPPEAQRAIPDVQGRPAAASPVVQPPAAVRGRLPGWRQAWRAARDRLLPAGARPWRLPHGPERAGPVQPAADTGRH